MDILEGGHCVADDVWVQHFAFLFGLVSALFGLKSITGKMRGNPAMVDFFDQVFVL